MRSYSVGLLGIILVIGLALIAGCAGTVELGVDRTATPDYSATATLAAVLNENARLATEVAREVTPTPVTLDLGEIAYVQGGDIWAKALPDGRAQRLTNDGRNSRPRWSPSGHWLAFLKEKPVVEEQEVPCDSALPRTHRCFQSVNAIQPQAWLIQSDGTGGRALAQGNAVDSFAWSPRDDRIAYVTALGELQVINADDTGFRALVPGSTAGGATGTVGRIAWSPDGLWIAYEWKIQQPKQSATYQGIWRVKVDGTGQAELYSSNITKKLESTLGRWFAGGQALLFWQGDLDSPSVTEGVPPFRLGLPKNSTDGITVDRIISDSMLAYADYVATAPDKTSWGDRGALALVVGSGRASWSNKRIYIDASPITPKNFAAISPSWSPDGSAIAFAAMPDAPSLAPDDAAAAVLMQRRIWVVNTGGEPQPRLLTSTESRDEHPLWSADGATILFVRLDVSGQASLWTVRADGSDASQVVPELTPSLDPLGFYGHLDWDVLFDWWKGRGR